MIAVDTSTVIAFVAGEKGGDVEALAQALAANQACLPPVVITELLSASNVPERLARLLLSVVVLETEPGYWERAGQLRARVRARGSRAFAEALICQSCLDHNVALITRDADFQPFAKHCGLRLW